jgi:hypothetical protein
MQLSVIPWTVDEQRRRSQKKRGIVGLDFLLLIVCASVSRIITTVISSAVTVVFGFGSDLDLPSSLPVSIILGSSPETGFN